MLIYRLLQSKTVNWIGRKAALANIDEIRKLSDPIKYVEIQKKREEFRKHGKKVIQLQKLK